jgi:hypothetical protein
MNYFTRERYLAMQNSEEAAMEQADADWEHAVDQYVAYLESIRPEMPEVVRQLVDGFYLHDAHVLSVGQRGDTFVISLQVDVPPSELLTITYTLAGPAEIREELFPWVKLAGVVDWLYEEIELVRSGDCPSFIHSILFANGWEARIPFRAVHLATAFPLLPLPHSRTALQTPDSISPTA